MQIIGLERSPRLDAAQGSQLFVARRKEEEGRETNSSNFYCCWSLFSPMVGLLPSTYYYYYYCYYCRSFSIIIQSKKNPQQSQRLFCLIMAVLLDLMLESYISEIDIIWYLCLRLIYSESEVQVAHSRTSRTSSLRAELHATSP